MNRHLPRPIAEADVAADVTPRAGRRGVGLKGLFDGDWVARLNAAIERVKAKPGPLGEAYGAESGEAGVFGDRFVWTFDPDFRALALDSPVGEIAGALMRSRTVNLYCDHLLVKEPGTPTHTPWHHDLQAWPIEGTQVCSIWIALDRVTAESGAVEYVAGSHRWGKRFRSSSFGRKGRDGQATYGANAPDNEAYEEPPDIDRERDRHRILRWDMKPGDCQVFHALTVHGAPGNTAKAQRRRAISLRLAGDDVRWFARPGKTAQLIRDAGLKPGDRLSQSDLFPEIWPARAGAA